MLGKMGLIKAISVNTGQNDLEDLKGSTFRCQFLYESISRYQQTITNLTDTGHAVPDASSSL